MAPKISGHAHNIQSRGALASDVVEPAFILHGKANCCSARRVLELIDFDVASELVRNGNSSRLHMVDPTSDGLDVHITVNGPSPCEDGLGLACRQEFNVALLGVRLHDATVPVTASSIWIVNTTYRNMIFTVHAECQTSMAEPIPATQSCSHVMPRSSAMVRALDVMEQRFQLSPLGVACTLSRSAQYLASTPARRHCCAGAEPNV